LSDTGRVISHAIDNRLNEAQPPLDGQAACLTSVPKNDPGAKMTRVPKGRRRTKLAVTYRWQLLPPAGKKLQV
jgi:hypothetical protein